MKFTKSIAIVLVVSCLVALLSICVSAKSDDEYYERLWQQKQDYLWEIYEDQMEDGYWWGDYSHTYPCIPCGLFVLLYTSAGEQLTIEKCGGSAELELEIPVVLASGKGFYLYSPEIAKSIKGCYFEGITGAMRFPLRESMKYFGISREELKNAYKTMEENPDAIRPLLSFLTDEEYESLKDSDGKFGVTPPEFIFEAACMENDTWAQTLICKPYAVYVEELGRIATDAELFQLNYATEDLMSDEKYEEFLSYDLTTRSMDEFWTYKQRVVKYFSPRAIKFAAEREKQLANPKTGENIIFLPVAAIALTLGVFAIFPRKKRRFE